MSVKAPKSEFSDPDYVKFGFIMLILWSFIWEGGPREPFDNQIWASCYKRLRICDLVKYTNGN